MPKVLAVGVYLIDCPNSAAHVIFELAGAVQNHVTQRWAALGSVAPDAVLPCTVRLITPPAPKFSILNELIGNLGEFDWVILCDDDVEMPPGFVDDFLKLATRFDFALCQPARTHDSFTDHHFVTQLPGLLARRTRFVEVGPVTCVRRDAFPIIFPFDASIGMGWGLDFIWPVRLEKAGLRMGIIDAVPIAHRLRKPVRNYSYSVADKSMKRLLSANEHLAPKEAFRIVESYT
jgi:hypothetical protein